MDPRVCGPLRTDGGGMCSPGPVSLSCLRPGVPSGEHDERLRACWPQDIHVYQASATPNPGTTPELRVEACARGCLSRVPAVASSPYTWQGNVGIFHLRGFQIYGSGDCWCTAQRSSLCTQTLDTREQRDGSTAQRYDLVARDTRQQRNASAFSNECDRPITWPWLHRDAHGIRFLELDEALNYGDANGWNAGATTTQWRTSFDKIPVRAIDADSVHVDPRPALDYHFLNAFTSVSHQGGPAPAAGEAYGGYDWGSHLSCSQQAASSKWDLSGTPLSLTKLLYGTGTTINWLGTGRQTEATHAGDCYYGGWRWASDKQPYAIVLQYTPLPAGVSSDRKYYNGNDAVFLVAAGSTTNIGPPMGTLRSTVKLHYETEKDGGVRQWEC